MEIEDYKRLMRELLRGDIESLGDAYSLIVGLREQGSTQIIDGQGEKIGGIIYDRGNLRLALQYAGEIKKKVGEIVKKTGSSEGLEIYYRTLCFEAPYNFDSYNRAIEFKRDAAEQFYQPRRGYLKKYVDAYQEVLDGKIRFLSISMPKRCGKSETGIRFTTQLSGRHPERATLMEGTGTALVASFYKGCLSYFSSEEYYDIFPTVRVVATNADFKTIDLNQKNRFATIMCRSIDATQVGLSEATNLLYLDDCVEGSQEAENRQRLEEKWEALSGDVVGRALPGVPIVISGTRYSLYDPIGRMQDYARSVGWSYKIIEEPSLDFQTDESNFEYYDPRFNRPMFTTEYFREQRKLLTERQFMSEFQQRPFESHGLLFPESRLNRYYELPVDQDPDAVIAVCDTAEGKGDSVMMPIAYLYGDEVFIEDVVFSDATPEHTKPECAKKLIDHNVSTALFESNAAGKYFARDVEALVREWGGQCSIRHKFTISSKDTRIEYASDNILKHFWFKDESLYEPASEYGRMIRELTTYTRMGKIAHDDAPDGLSLLENELKRQRKATVTLIKRFF